MKVNNNAQTFKVLRDQHNGSLVWKAKCLMQTRLARNIPAVYPSALSAALATPESDRIYQLNALRRGMVGYCDDPNDGNPYGHIFTIAGRNSEGEILCWTNDMVRTGGVDLVRFSDFKTKWGDTFQFGAISLNGYEFPDFVAKPKVPKFNQKYKDAIELLKKERDWHKRKGNTKIVAMLERDIDRMQRKLKKINENS